jgi:hypothetical protein
MTMKPIELLDKGYRDDYNPKCFIFLEEKIFH